MCEDELKKILNKKEPYPDFTLGVIKALSTDKMKSEMLEYLINCPEASDQDIEEKIAELRGVERVS